MVHFVVNSCIHTQPVGGDNMRFEHVYLHLFLQEIFFLHFGTVKTIVFKVLI